jgi:protein CpxP
MNKLGKIKTLTIASLSAVALAAPIAFAQSTTTTQDTPQATGERHGGHGKGWGDKGREGRGWGGERGAGGGRRGGMMFGELNLTDDQKARMKVISQSFRESTKSLHEQLRAKRQELRQAGEGGTFNEALATQKLQESAGLQAKLMGEQFRMRQQMLSVLTPEQKTQLEQKRAEFKAKRANHGERKVQ